MFVTKTMDTPLNPITAPVSLEKFAYESIKTAIIQFMLAPGQSLVESDLAAQLCISKTPVRDALLRLEREGLVKKVAYKGTYVAEITNKGIADTFRIRAQLESLAARMACGKLSGRDIDDAQKFVNLMDESIRKGEKEQASAYNAFFHELIISKTESEWLNQILSNLDDHLKRYRTLSNNQDGRLAKSAHEHQVVLDAIRQHKPDDAETLMKQHILSVLEDLETQEDLNHLVQRVSQATR
jgi:DNA-binding GntR family transcriptional regulator